MAHRVSPRAEADLDEIWLYVARESGNVETADRLIDAITDRFLTSRISVDRTLPRAGLRPRVVHGRRQLETLFGH